MSIRITCKSCNRQFKVKDQLANKRIRCPFCGGRLEVPGREPDMEGALQSEELGTGFRVCPSCAERIRAQARKCRFCGEPLPRNADEEDSVDWDNSLWEAFSEMDLAVIEEGASPFSGTRGREGVASEAPKRQPPEHQKRRRELKRFMRELRRLDKQIEMSEFEEVRESLRKVREEILGRCLAVLDEAKKEDAVEEELAWDGEVRYRFKGEKKSWTLPKKSQP